MKKITFTEAQILGILKEQEQGLKVSEICRKHGISDATFYNWKNKYAGMTIDELKRLIDLEYENARLKKMYANLSLENVALKDILSKILTPEQKVQCLLYLKDAHHKLSHSQACRMINCTRTKAYYQKKMPLKDIQIKQAIDQFLGNSRKGRTKVIKLVQKAHPGISSSRIRRVYERSGLALSKRLKRRIKDNPANPIEMPFTSNEEWALDFMSDALADGRKIRTLNVIDHFNRKCLGIKIGFNLPARVVIKVMEQVIEMHGKPERFPFQFNEYKNQF